MPRGPQCAPNPPAQETHGAVLRDQRRALHAYDKVHDVPQNDRKSYKIAVNDLGANIMRHGLAGAMAAMERRGDEGAQLLLDHLGNADIPGLQGTSRETLPDRVRRLGIDDYILATRETLLVALWLKRAVQATFEGD